MLRKAGDRSAIAMALGAIAEVESRDGDFSAAAAHSEEAVRLVAELSSVEEITQHRIFLAQQLWLAGERERAQAELSQARQEADRSGILENRVAAYVMSAELARLSGDLAGAREHLDRASAVAADLRPDSDYHGTLATTRGFVATAAGDLDAARALFHEALDRVLSSGDAMAISRALIGVADYAVACDRPEYAAELLGVSEAIRGLPDRSAIDADRVEAAARAVLGESRFAEAYERGRQTGSRQQASERARLTLSA